MDKYAFNKKEEKLPSHFWTGVVCKNCVGHEFRASMFSNSYELTITVSCCNCGFENQIYSEIK